MKIRLGSIVPLKKKTPEGQTVFSGSYECYDKQTYLKLVQMFDEEVEVSKEQATVMPSAQVALSEILTMQSEIAETARRLVEECCAPVITVSAPECMGCERVYEFKAKQEAEIIGAIQ